SLTTPPTVRKAIHVTVEVGEADDGEQREDDDHRHSEQPHVGWREPDVSPDAEPEREVVAAHPCMPPRGAGGSSTFTVLRQAFPCVAGVLLPRARLFLMSATRPHRTAAPEQRAWPRSTCRQAHGTVSRSHRGRAETSR